MKYRHSFHAGNFADVHKHVTLLALLAALARKDKGFFFLETHAGRGAYDLSGAPASHESAGGIARLHGAAPQSEELGAYLRTVEGWRSEARAPHGYPGSPLLATRLLRPQDRAVLIELRPEEARALSRALGTSSNVRVEPGDGFECLRAHLPPRERRGLTLIDPPYETALEASRAESAILEILRRFATGVIALWYPIKDARDTAAWLARLGAGITVPALVGELWVHPCDSQVALNGSGMLIVNPPFKVAERMREWLPELHARLDVDRQGGTSVRMLREA
jgi:23S rRNA (adenine2030-N6)-methyltransferase